MADYRGRYGNVDGTRLAGTPRHARAAEDVGNEEVPVGIRGFQLSKRRPANVKMEIIDVWSGSTIAARSGRAFDRGGECPGAVSHDRRRYIGESREAPRDGHGRSVQRGGDVRNLGAGPQAVVE